MIAVLGLHGPIPPDLHDRMAMVAGAGAHWSVVHWMSVWTLWFGVALLRTPAAAGTARAPAATPRPAGV